MGNSSTHNWSSRPFLIQFSVLKGKWTGKSHRIGAISDKKNLGGSPFVFLSSHGFTERSDRPTRNKNVVQFYCAYQKEYATFFFFTRLKHVQFIL